ncbi:aminopeptidase P family protein [Tenacibaculum sp. M341]|uniref:aminopeptidase P family protein n=1 Tax=Tenacibaculum sp. M341 TaxID=2530339 RepID=UPI00104BE073|nr:aminopeptidase P family protein [Tenacibaculum sp. M341]TCI84573.1 aminopeptidase P family protein [Tenacibaculum sp. M341]
MKQILFSVFLLSFYNLLVAQTPTDYLSKEFHKNRREILRQKMSKNSVAVVFANPIRNRANDVDYVFHQDPDFYYLTGLREPNAVVLIFSENRTDKIGNTYNEVIYLPKKDPIYELWNGKRLGVEGAKSQLGFSIAKTSEEFIEDAIDFTKFDEVYIKDFEDDYRNSLNKLGEVYDLVKSFKRNSNYNTSASLSEPKKKVYELIKATPVENAANVAQALGKVMVYYPDLEKDELIQGYRNTSDTNKIEAIKEKATLKLSIKHNNINKEFLSIKMAQMREIKTAEELKLLTKAIRISAVGQIEVMKAMKPHMSETEIQGIHEFVYKKYGAEYEGYPSIVGAGNNGCILHYIENNRTKVDNDLVLMDLGAEYRGYTADVTRTIPANGKFSPEQKAIYEIVLEAQNAGIAVCKVGNQFWAPGQQSKTIINEGLLKLGIIKSIDEKHSYFPHGTSHHIGLDVHDPGTYGKLAKNMVITVEPGIYIPEGSSCDKKWWGIAVRIEDDILITEQGPKNLSEEAPRTIKAIEKMMAKKSVLDDFILPSLD